MNVGKFDPKILKIYEAATFQVKDITGKLISFRVNDEGYPPVLKLKRFSILTASNPMNQETPESENQKKNALLEADLEASGLVYYSTTDISKAHAEKAFTVEGIQSETAAALGRKYRQYAVLYCDQSGPYFVRCAQPAD